MLGRVEAYLPTQEVHQKRRNMREEEHVKGRVEAYLFVSLHSNPSLCATRKRQKPTLAHIEGSSKAANP